MIIDKKLTIKIAKYNIEHYKQFFDVKLKDIIEIDTELHLQKESNKKINVQCDICTEQRYIKYQAYTKNINSSTKYPIYTCDKCSHIKIKEYNREKYGVEYYSQHPDRNDKVKNTSINKYGVEHFSKSNLFKEKISKTNLEKFGYINPFMDTERIKDIFFKKYGVYHPSNVKEFYELVRTKNEENGNWIHRDLRSEFYIYKNKVRHLTNINIKLLDWDGTDYYDSEYIKDNFNLHFNDNSYPTIDHKTSIYDGFINNKPASEIAGVDNLCWTKRIINITKNKSHTFNFFTDIYL